MSSIVVQRVQPDDLVPSRLIRLAWKSWREKEIAKAGYLMSFASMAIQVLIVYIALQVVGMRVFLPLATVLLVAVVALGFWRSYRLYKQQDDQKYRWLDARGMAALTSLCAVAAAGLIAVRVSALSVLVSLAALEFLSRMPVKGESKHWTASTRMARNMVSAAILSMTKDSQGRPRVPTLQARGKMRTHDWGEEMSYTLPEGVPWQRVSERHSQLASAMRVPPEHLLIRHKEGSNGGDVEIAVLNPMPTALQSMPIPDDVDFTAGVPIGRDRVGRFQTFKTVVHSMIIGTTGSGKTRAACWITIWALLDPRVRVFIIDGKDDLKDWRPAEHLCEAYVGGATRHSLPKVQRVLSQIEDLVIERARTGDRSPVFVVVDEWARIRSAAKRHGKAMEQPQLGNDLDGLLMDLCATARSFGVRFLIIGQRGTAEFFPTDMRANLAQRLVGRVAEDTEASYVYDRMPDVLPLHFGHFLMAEDGSTDITMVPFPDFDEQAFAALCEEAAVRRKANPLPPLVTSLPVAAPTDQQIEDTVESLVLAILSNGPALTATTIMRDLPDRLAPTSNVVMGKILGRMAEEGLVKRKTCADGKTPGWTLAK